MTGTLVRVGFHEELGASPSVVARDVHGVEHYARLAMSSGLPSVGAQATLGMGAHGMVQLVGRAASHQAGMEL